MTLEKTPELVFDILSEHWALEGAGGKLLRGWLESLVHGQATPVLATRDGAAAYAEQVLTDRKYRKQYSHLTPVSVGAPFAFMRRAAKQGSCGISVLGQARGARRFLFTKAVANARARWPTHLTAIARLDFAGLSLGKDAIESIPLSELVYFDGKGFLDHPTILATYRKEKVD